MDGAFRCSRGLKACRKGSAWQEALFLFQGFQAARGTPNVVLLGALAACFDPSSWSLALELFALAKTLTLRCDAVLCNTLLSACGKSKSWRAALGVFAGMRSTGLQGSVVSYNAAVSACQGWPGWQTAVCLLEDLGKTFLKATVISINSAISACESWQQSMSCMSALRRQSFQPDLVSFNTAISSSPWPGSLRLFRELRDVHLEADVVTASISGAIWEQGCANLQSESNVIACNAAMSSCEWRKASSLLTAMGSARVEATLRSFNILQSVHERAAWSQASAWMSRQCTLSLLPDLFSFNSLTSTASWVHCLDLLRQLARWDLRMDRITCSSCVDACEGFVWPWTLELLNMVTGADVDVYNAAMSGCQEEKWQMAILLLDKAQQLRLRSDEVSWNEVSVAFQRCSAWAHALCQGQNLIQHNSALAACEKTGMWRQSIELLKGRATDSAGRNSALASLAAASRWRQGLEVAAENSAAAAAACELQAQPAPGPTVSRLQRLRP
ncbi:unnamed protein product [Effrenium voratum]|uniref:Pentatricopeptide repeat-containing protein, chloroplastic n=1 Tax=Effrenium voratum TaxID=2562239 RepID=A0AA36NLQ6_9DINO|nr:unnamed protein product [Effrenium voratum]